MSTEEFTIALFCRVDDTLGAVGKHPQALLHPSEVATLALLFALKGVGERAFYRWLVRDLAPLFPALPERTRLFRLFRAHLEWIAPFMAEPTVLGVADSYGIELIHPWREGRSPKQIGKKGLSNRRWIVGGKLAVVLNQWGLVAGWDCATANVYDATFHPLIARFAERMVVLTDGGERGGGRPAEQASLPSRRVERPDGGRDGALDAHRGLPREAHESSRVGGVPRAPRLAAGGVQRARAVARPRSRRRGAHPPLDCRVQPLVD